MLVLEYLRTDLAAMIREAKESRPIEVNDVKDPNLVGSMLVRNLNF